MREIKLLRKLTEMESNIYTTRIVDIIVPQNTLFDENNEMYSDINFEQTNDTTKTDVKSIVVNK